jgi:hypothetical protein
MSRVTVRPPFFLHPEEIPAPAEAAADPFAATLEAGRLPPACSLLAEALREGSPCPEELKERARAAATTEEIEAVVEDLARWGASAGD